MGVHNLDRIFRPRRVAVIGASDRAGSVGGTVLRNLVSSGFRGVVYPVNPKREAVQGIQAYGRVAEVPKTPDLAVVCTPAVTVPGLVRECGEAGVLGILVISAGFREAGDDGRGREDEVRRAAREFPGLRILGPNCLGIIVPELGLNATFGAGMPKSGRVAFVSQSGALCTAVLDWALDADVGFSCFVSIGNMIDVDFADIIDYLSADARTEGLILYVESISEAREFMSAARAFTRSKPIVAYKAGRFAESAAAAQSHTGAMAGADVVYEAAFERAGIVRVSEMEEMFACAELLARYDPPVGPRLGIVSNAGGPAVMATDALIASRGKLAVLGDETRQRLDDILPPYWSRGNPVDVLGDASKERFAHAIEIVLADDEVDAALAILAPQAMTDPTATAEAVATVAAHAHKPILAAWLGGGSMTAGAEVLDRAGVATYGSPEAAVRAFTHLVAWARRRDILYETPRDLVAVPVEQAWRGRSLFELERAPSGDGVLGEIETKRLLAGYGIRVNEARAAQTADEAATISGELGYPVVLKVLSPDILHKTDVGGVALNLQGEDEVRRAFDDLHEHARAARPDARLEGVTVQPMVAAPGAVELILGATKDPTFGTAIMIGAGGITAELYEDRAVGLPPLNERLALRMLRSLRTWPLLTGYRGRPAVDVDHLVEQLIRFSYLVADHPEISEIDVNPLLVSADGAMALDGRVILDRALRAGPTHPYEHLVIRPYPEQYVRRTELSDGTMVTLRPIRPEDEPAWHEMLGRCSAESLWFRFRALFKGTTHKMATRYCFIDYDREMAIVAEAEEDGERKLVGVGRLVGDPDVRTAEYAVLIVDDWQGRRLGSVLTDYCLEIARDWGFERVVAETSLDNRRMIAVFRRRGFDVTSRPEDGYMIAGLDVGG